MKRPTTEVPVAIRYNWRIGAWVHFYGDVVVSGVSTPTVSSLAVALGTTDRLIYEAIHSGKLKAQQRFFVKHPQQWYIKDSDRDAWLASMLGDMQYRRKTNE